jgi:hypothetical protein
MALIRDRMLGSSRWVNWLSVRSSLRGSRSLSLVRSRTKNFSSTWHDRASEPAGSRGRERRTSSMSSAMAGSAFASLLTRIARK